MAPKRLHWIMQRCIQAMSERTLDGVSQRFQPLELLAVSDSGVGGWGLGGV